MSSKTVYDFSTGRYGVVENGSGPGRRSRSVADALMAGSREDEEELRQGLWLNAFQVYYQPVVDVGSGDLVGAEALLRWRRKHELLPASAFIRMAERTGVVLRLGARALRAAVTMRAGCGLPLDRGPRISVNLAREELLQPDLAAGIAALLHETALAPELLEIEVSEHTLTPGDDEVPRAMRALWDIGVPCTLDDLGAGSLGEAALGSLPLVAAKVDLPTALRTDETLGACVRNIDRAQSLGITVIAKRVEGYDELELMTWLEIAVAQGYAFGEPAPEAVFREIVADAQTHAAKPSNGNGTHADGAAGFAANGNGTNGAAANGANGHAPDLRSPRLRQRRPARTRRNGNGR